MSQNQSNSKIPSSDELEHFKKPELQAFLKARGVGSTGNKDVLLKMAKLYANRPVVTVPSDNTSSQPDDSVIVWQNAATGTAPIPSGFTLETITNYLSEVSSNLSLSAR